jgi:hypothetical protein
MTATRRLYSALFCQRMWRSEHRDSIHKSPTWKLHYPSSFVLGLFHKEVTEMLEFLFSRLPSIMQQSEIKSFQNSSLHYMFRPTRPSSGVLSFGETAVPSAHRLHGGRQTTEKNSSINCNRMLRYNITSVSLILLSSLCTESLWSVMSELNEEEHLQNCSAAMGIEKKRTVFKFTLKGSPGSSVARESVPLHMMTVSLASVKPKRTHRHRRKSHHSHGHYQFHYDTSWQAWSSHLGARLLIGPFT